MIRILLTFTVLMACGSAPEAKDEAVNTEASVQNPNKTGQSRPSSIYLESSADLPECLTENQGVLAYIADEEQFYYCETDWNPVDIKGKDGTAGKDGAKGADGQDGLDGENGTNGDSQGNEYLAEADETIMGTPFWDGLDIYLDHESGVRIPIQSLATGHKKFDDTNTRLIHYNMTRYYDGANCIGSVYVSDPSKANMLGDLSLVLPVWPKVTVALNSYYTQAGGCVNWSGSMSIHPTAPFTPSLPMKIVYQ